MIRALSPRWTIGPFDQSARLTSWRTMKTSPRPARTAGRREQGMSRASRPWRCANRPLNVTTLSNHQSATHVYLVPVVYTICRVAAMSIHQPATHVCLVPVVDTILWCSDVVNRSTQYSCSLGSLPNLWCSDIVNPSIRYYYSSMLYTCRDGV